MSGRARGAAVEMRILPFLVLGLPVLFTAAFLTFDSLVLLERARYPDEWEKDGWPRPFFRKASALEWSLRGWFATQWCSLAWLFISPRWATPDSEARRLLRRLRVLVICWCLLVVPAFAFSASVVGRRD